MLRTPIPNAGERREWPRYRAAPQIALSVEGDGRRHPCALENLSLGGACLNFPESDIPANAKLRLDVPDVGLIRLERRWRSGQVLGVMFDYSDASLAFVQSCLERFMDDGNGMPEVSA